MEIIAKSNFSGLEFNAITGQVLDLSEEIARDLIQAGYAEAMEVKAPKAEAPKVEAVKEVANNEDKRDNAGADIKPVKRKRTSSKRN